FLVANQQIRVDIMQPGASTLDVGSGVLLNVFRTNAGTATSQVYMPMSVDLTAFKGQTIRLRFAATNNQGVLVVGVDNVRLSVKYIESTRPTLSSLALRNPGFG